MADFLIELNKFTQPAATTLQKYARRMCSVQIRNRKLREAEERRMQEEKDRERRSWNGRLQIQAEGGGARRRPKRCRRATLCKGRRGVSMVKKMRAEHQARLEADRKAAADAAESPGLVG